MSAKRRAALLALWDAVASREGNFDDFATGVLALSALDLWIMECYVHSH